MNITNTIQRLKKYTSIRRSTPGAEHNILSALADTFFSYPYKRIAELHDSHFLLYKILHG